MEKEPTNNLPMLIGDVNDLSSRIKEDKFLRVVNQNPPSEFVKDHPLVKGVKYIPIDKIELMLTKIFQEWHIEILSVQQLLNSLAVTVRLHYTHPLTGEKLFQDGVGAVQIQVDKGENASNLSAIKPDAIMKGLPSAKSFAIKDAAEHIGVVFGRNMNRKDTIAFIPTYDNRTTLELLDANAKKKQAIINAQNNKEG
jgi:hypothetical protein